MDIESAMYRKHLLLGNHLLSTMNVLRRLTLLVGDEMAPWLSALQNCLNPVWYLTQEALQLFCNIQVHVLPSPSAIFGHKSHRLCWLDFQEWVLFHALIHVVEHAPAFSLLSYIHLHFYNLQEEAWNFGANFNLPLQIDQPTTCHWYGTTNCVTISIKGKDLLSKQAKHFVWTCVRLHSLAIIWFSGCWKSDLSFWQDTAILWHIKTHSTLEVWRGSHASELYGFDAIIITTSDKLSSFSNHCYCCFSFQAASKAQMAYALRLAIVYIAYPGRSAFRSGLLNSTNAWALNMWFPSKIDR